MQQTMLETLCDSWNKLYQIDGKDKRTPAKLLQERVTVAETGPRCEFNKLTFAVDKAIDFHSRELETFILWGALSGKNCDGAYLVKNLDESYDLVLVELKSSFDTDDLFKAKTQIVETFVKMNILLQGSRHYGEIRIRRRYGLIVSRKPRPRQLAWLKQMANLSDKQLKEDHRDQYFGVSLYKYGRLVSVVNKNESQKEFSPSAAPDTFEFFYYSAENSSADIRLEDVAPL